MKRYQTIEVEVFVFTESDVVRTSGEHAYGTDNVKAWDWEEEA